MVHSPLRIGIIGAGVMGMNHAKYVADDKVTILIGMADPFSRHWPTTRVCRTTSTTTTC